MSDTLTAPAIASRAFRSEAMATLAARGFLHQATDADALDAAFAAGPVTLYNGFDPTGDSLHVGHLLPIMMLRWMQKTGHRPIALMGGGTTKIGDPSGKDESRQLLTAEAINANIASIELTFRALLEFGGSNPALLLNNAAWLEPLGYIDLLRDVGRHFTVNRMLTFDSVRLRLEREQPLTFLEFNYMILQSYDFVELYKLHGCTLQTGGSDQWGNIVSGVDLGRRIADAALYGLTCPLITTATGAKMGKTAAGAVWLKPERLSPYAYWQFWRNTDDADVGRFLRLFTDLPLDEIARLEKLGGAEINEAKKRLAHEATSLLHGLAAAEAAAETARKTFEEGTTGADLPRIDVARADLNAGIGVAELFRRAGLTASVNEARRLIAQGGAKVNDRTVTDSTTLIGSAELASDGTIKLSAGKKRHALVQAA